MGFFADVGRANVPQRIGAAISNVAAIEDIKMARMKQQQLEYEMEPIDVTNSQFAQGLAEAGDHLSAAWPKYVKMMGYDPTNLPRGKAMELRQQFFTKDWDRIGKIQAELDQRNMKSKMQQLIEKRAAFNSLQNPTLKEQAANDRNEQEIKRISSKLAVLTGKMNQIPKMQSQINAEAKAALEQKRQESEITEARQMRMAAERSRLTEERQKRTADYKAGLKGETTGEDKTLKGLKGSYETFVKQYYAALKGTDIFTSSIKSERETVAKDSLRKAQELAIQYVKKGGDARDLGITPEGIREDFKAGTITKEKAMYLLKQLFGEAPK